MTKDIVFVGEGSKEVRWDGRDIVLEAGASKTVDADTADGLVSNHTDVKYAEGFSKTVREDVPKEAPVEEPVVVEEVTSAPEVPVEAEVVPDEAPVEEKGKKGKK